MRVAGCLLPWFLAGCFSPDLAQWTFRCDEASPNCPSGYSCRAGSCVEGEVDPGPPPGAVDLSTPEPADLAAVNGCRNAPGAKVGLGYACPGRLGNAPGTNAGNFCAVGFRPCLDASAIDLVACSKLSGFFVANVGGHLQLNMAANVVCGVGGSNNTVWFGCGGPRPSISNYPTGCSGFMNFLLCGQDATWSCGVPTLGEIQTTVDTDGVLCCPLTNK